MTAVDDAKEEVRRAHQLAVSARGVFLRETTTAYVPWAHAKAASIVRTQTAVINSLSPEYLRAVKERVSTAIQSGAGAVDSAFSHATNLEAITDGQRGRLVSGFDNEFATAKRVLTTSLWRTLDAAGYRLYPGSENWSDEDTFESDAIDLGNDWASSLREFRKCALALSKTKFDLQKAETEAAEIEAGNAWDRA